MKEEPEFIEEQEDALLEQKVVAIRRVAKVVAGGRRFRFAALVAVGTGNGVVGIGTGKAHEVPLAVQKAAEKARKSAKVVPLVHGTVPFDVVGKYNSTKVVVRRAREGTGIIAGGAARSILEVAGVKNVLTKILGSRNPYNVALATMQALEKIRTINSRAVRRGKKSEVVLPEEDPRVSLEEKLGLADEGDKV